MKKKKRLLGHKQCSTITVNLIVKRATKRERKREREKQQLRETERKREREENEHRGMLERKESWLRWGQCGIAPCYSK
jgi:hypothetical protein